MLGKHPRRNDVGVGRSHRDGPDRTTSVHTKSKVKEDKVKTKKRTRWDGARTDLRNKVSDEQGENLSKRVCVAEEQDWLQNSEFDEDIFGGIDHNGKDIGGWQNNGCGSSNGLNEHQSDHGCIESFKNYDAEYEDVFGVIDIHGNEAAWKNCFSSRLRCGRRSY